VVYTDFEKAFDKVLHKRLMQKLRAYGIGSELLNWIGAFLTDRKQRVRVQGRYSKWSRVISGIPQGSVLGPLLFIIYINDLPDLIEQNASISLYADDAKIYKHVREMSDGESLQKAVEDMNLWCNSWMIKINCAKCKSMTIGKSQKVKKFDLKMIEAGNEIVLDHENEMKDLGVTMDAELTFEDHINGKINKAYSMLGIIKRNFKYLDEQPFVNLYKTMVRSHLEYAATVWSPTKKGLIEDIEKVQRRATKMIRKCKNMTYEERLRYLKLPTLKFRRIRGDMIELYKMLTGVYEADACPVMKLHEGRETRGHSLKFTKERTYTRERRTICTERMVEIWNSLPSEVVEASSVNVFKSRIDRFFISQEVYYNYEAEIAETENRSWK